MRPVREEVLPEQATYPRQFDLLIVDEAHNVAPSGRGKYTTDSLRTLAIRRLAPHFEHRLFLSATPHNGYPESFTALLELLDNQRFARGVAPDRTQLQAIMVRRLKCAVNKFEEFAAANPDTMSGIRARAVDAGLIAHRFFASVDGDDIIVVDEWPDA